MTSFARRLSAAFAALLLPAVMTAQSPIPPTSYVNPFIGTGGHGHTFPGATVPFGMVQLSPDTRLEGWDGCSGYHYSDTLVYGFSHTHLSGTGCSDYGDILFMPVAGREANPLKYTYASPFRKRDETAAPGYYKVKLPANGVTAELTATARAGFHRYTFNVPGKEQVVVDLKHRDKVLASGIRIIGPDEIEGYRISRVWADSQMVYFVAKFSKPFTSAQIWSGDKILTGAKESEGTELRAVFTFDGKEGDQILVRAGISGVDIEGARKNMESEIGGKDFDTVAAAALKVWNDELSRIAVENGTLDQQVIFYTSLYHTMVQPNIYCDVDGRYRGRDLKIHKTDSLDYYTVFSLWDTYRAANPLYTIIQPKRVNGFINTFLRQYDEGGMLPVWELSGNETGCMIGYHSAPVIADAWQKGIRGYDGEKALQAMKHSAEQDHLGLKYYRSKGYIPADKEGESVSKTLEYAYDDWCIAITAKSLGKTEDFKTYIGRAQSYKNVFDPITGFMRAKSNETLFKPFDPAEVNFNYTEANAWQYSFYAPHDNSSLMRLMGGREAYAKKLDDLFTADSKTSGREQADITGLIGQYAHGNEPSHHMAYLYDYAGYPWKTQELVHRICSEFYRNAPDGLIGNEDCGQMSAWYIFSAMGFYPVTPGAGFYAFGTPVFPRASIRLENGKTFTVRALNLSDKNIYIQSVTLNGKPWTKCYLMHTDIAKGGELALTMGPQPNKAWGVGYGSFPDTYVGEYLIVPVPMAFEGQKTFLDSTLVAITDAQPGVNIFYTLDGSEPTPRSSQYKRPLLLRKTTTLRAIAVNAELQHSLPIEATFTKIPKNRRITLLTPYAGQYSGGGDLALIDFTRGGDEFRTGGWQGYEGNDLSVVIDLGETLPVKKLSLGCLQDQGSWIFMPSKVDWFISADGTNFTPQGTVENTLDERRDGPVIREFGITLKGVKTRYIKVTATNRGTCPAWHPGAGSKAWIFADEITIE